MTPELRLIRYFVAVAELENVTRAAERLQISQPSLSAAIKQLEAQLGVELLARSGRRVTVTPAGALLLTRGRELLDHADRVTETVRARGVTKAGRLRLGLSPTARHGTGPRLLAACAERAPAVMLYTSEDTTGALLRDLTAGRLDAAVTFCAPDTAAPGLEFELVEEEPAVVHLPATHPLAQRDVLTPADLAGETILVAAGHESAGFTTIVLDYLAANGVVPRTRPDPYPDLGLQAIREGLGIVIYVRGAFPQPLEGSAFAPLEPPLALPFHLARRTGRPPAAVRTLLEVVRGRNHRVNATTETA